jgi:hypothetical protein
LPSLSAAARDARETLQRFPAVLFAALVAAAIGMIMAGRSGSNDVLTGILAAASLGLPLFLATAIAAERTESRTLSIVLAALGLAILVGFAFAWLHWSDAIQVRRYAQFSIGFHLLVAYLPYVFVDEPNGFWHWNRTLFLRFLTAALYSAVLYVGLVVALVAIDKLLQVKIPSSAYLRLWIAIAFVFNTWFFLGGVPRDLAALESRRDYPRGLKVFSQFILIPLVIVYLAILTLYLGRILITGQWPSGWIGYLVSGVAAIGILSLLLVHPIREYQENRWVASYARWFYVALLPAIGMLLVSIGKRVAQYGVTEDRYFLAVLSLWLLAIAVTFIVRRATDIRVIPLTLCLLAFATAFGPQGAYAVSRGSQIRHLREVLARYGMLDHDGPRPATAEVPFAARRELSSTLTYLFGTHGTPAVRSVLGAAASDTIKAEATGGPYAQAQWRAAVTMRSLNLDFANPWDSPKGTTFTLYRRASIEVREIPRADYHVRLTGSFPMAFAIDGARWELRVEGRARRLTLWNGGRPLAAFPIDTLVAAARASLASADSTPPPHLTADTPDVRALLTANNYAGVAARDSVRFDSFDADLYLTLKNGRAAERDSSRSGASMR